MIGIMATCISCINFCIHTNGALFACEWKYFGNAVEVVSEHLNCETTLGISILTVVTWFTSAPLLRSMSTVCWCPFLHAT